MDLGILLMSQNLCIALSVKFLVAIGWDLARLGYLAKPPLLYLS